jgi:CIC family chloride channel protein
MRPNENTLTGEGRASLKSNHRQSLLYIAYILPVAVVAGIVGSGTVVLFNVALAALQRTALLLPYAPFLLPVAGAIVAGTLILRFFPGAGGEGVPLYLLAVNRDGGRFSFADTALKFPATILTLGTFGSGGIVGPLIRICSGFTSFVSGPLLSPFGVLRTEGLRMPAICGASAAVGAIFHTPLAGGIFAAEVLRRENLRYKDLFPAILASAAGVISSTYLFGQGAVFSVDAPRASIEPRLLPWLPLVALFAGGVGMTFIFVFERTAKLLARVRAGQPARALIGSIPVALIFLLLGKQPLGISMGLYNGLVRGNLDAAILGKSVIGSAGLLIAFIIAIKIAATSFTVGSGMSGGFTGPLVILGIASGALMSIPAGITPGEPAYYIFLACGLPAILGAVMNIPIAAALLSIELFGADYALPAAVGGIISFLLFKTRSVYGGAPIFDEAEE